MFHISTMGDDTAHIHDFRTHPQRSGIGTHALKELQQHAKTHGVKLHLHPEGYADTPTSVLKKFYKKHGFKGSSSDMTWNHDEPAKKPAKINEDGAPTVNAGGGMIAGIGVGPQGEPGRKANMMPLARRRAEVIKKVVKGKRSD